MAWFNRMYPKQFSFKPSYYVKPGEKKIAFERKGLYNPREHNHKPWKLFIILIVLAIMVYMSGGINLKSKEPKITQDNIVNIDDYLKTLKTPK